MLSDAGFVRPELHHLPVSVFPFLYVIQVVAVVEADPQFGSGSFACGKSSLLCFFPLHAVRF
jgi:hypothetical protein